MINIKKKGDELFISINIPKLEISLNGAPNSDLFVSDINTLLPELICELKSEDESGASIIHRALDEAANNASENGADGVIFTE
ncbi:MAG: hypothetical protein ACI88H_000112 [Cocleimonas sp.]|jgi:hypothetical protein